MWPQAETYDQVNTDGRNLCDQLKQKLLLTQSGETNDHADKCQKPTIMLGKKQVETPDCVNTFCWNNFA